MTATAWNALDTDEFADEAQVLACLPRMACRPPLGGRLARRPLPFQ
jgi:hypothetical protein